jgi:Na+-transporting methylmalonyl-CoA/oxaloacetate decarboxylase gamma subunit
MHWDQNIIFIIIAAIIGISRLVSRISEESKKQSQRRRQPPQRPPPQPEIPQPLQRTRPKTDEERVREFLEALGQAPGSTPPAKVQPRIQIPPRPLAPVQPPASMRPFAKPVFRTWKEQAKEIVVLQQPAKAAPPEIRRIVVPPPLPAEANEPGAWIEQDQTQTAAATKMSIARTDDQPSVRASADTIWKQALLSPNAARTAIILREIFGPPRGVQSSNFVFERI